MSDMTDIRGRLKSLVTEHHLSSIALLSQRLGVDPKIVQELLLTMVEEGTLRGRISDDGARFFRDDVTSEDHRVTSQSEDDELPAFMRYNERPGYIVAVLGLSIMSIAILLLQLSGSDIALENLSFVILLVGVFTMLCGCYHIGRRPTL